MKKFIVIIATTLALFSCGQRQTQKTVASIQVLQANCADVLMNESATWQQIDEVLTPFCDALMTASDDENDLQQRLLAQQASYMTINLLTDKLDEFHNKGVSVSEKDVKVAFEGLLYPSYTWFYEPNEQLPNIWRDQYYRSNQNAEKPVSGYFHLMLSLPSSEEPETSFHIFFPEAAESSPKLILRKYMSDNVTEEDMVSQILIEPENWTSKNADGEGFPMYATLTPKETSMIMDYDVLYISYLSAPAPSGELGEVEMARVELGPLHIIYQELLCE